MGDIPDDILAISISNLVCFCYYYTPNLFLIPNYKELVSNSSLQLQHSGTFGDQDELSQLW